jgi:RNA polymerase sigma factor (TIGR02999 family)
MAEFNELLARARAGEDEAGAALFAATYSELHGLARARLRRQSRRPGLLDTTSLLHESFVRLQKLPRLEVESRRHYLAYAARVMRSVIVDLARGEGSDKRGGGAACITLTTQLGGAADDGGEILRVHRALEQLERLDARLVQVVEMRYFAGMTEPEIAAALGLSDRTVRRSWEKARLLLAALLD